MLCNTVQNSINTAFSSRSNLSRFATRFPFPRFQPLLGFCILRRVTTASRRCPNNCTGRRRRSTSSLSWLFCYKIQRPTADSFAVSRWGIPPVICWQGSSASPLCFDIIACCPTHPSFNHRRSSFSGRYFPTVEHSAAECHTGVVNICFRKRLKTHLFNCSFPQISRSVCAVTLSFRTL